MSTKHVSLIAVWNHFFKKSVIFVSKNCFFSLDRSQVPRVDLIPSLRTAQSSTLDLQQGLLNVLVVRKSIPRLADAVLPALALHTTSLSLPSFCLYGNNRWEVLRNYSCSGKEAVKKQGRWGDEWERGTTLEHCDGALRIGTWEWGGNVKLVSLW